MFPKNPKLWTLWELLNPYTSWNAFKEEIDFLRLWKFPCVFSKKKIFFPKERNFGTLAEILSKNIICVGFYIKLAKIKDCEKNSSLSKKNPPVFQRKTKFETFENFKAKIPTETHSLKFLPKKKILQKFMRFFENTHLFSQNSHFFERFEFPRAKILLETQARRKMPRLPILEENLDLLKNNICFSKKPKSLIVLSFPMQLENLTRFLDKNCKTTCSWKIPSIFSTKNIIFPGKSQVWRFEIA